MIEVNYMCFAYVVHTYMLSFVYVCMMYTVHTYIRCCTVHWGTVVRTVYMVCFP